MGYIITNPPPRRCSPIAGLCVLCVSGGAALALLLVTPFIVHERVAEVQAAWDADVQAWAEQCDRAYQQGRADAEAMAALEKEAAQ